jgi:hypothetical protein
MVLVHVRYARLAVLAGRLLYFSGCVAFRGATGRYRDLLYVS